MIAQTINGPAHLLIWPTLYLRPGDTLVIMDYNAEYLATGRFTDAGYDEALYLDPDERVPGVIEPDMVPV